MSFNFLYNVKPLIWNNPSFVNPTDLVLDAAKENIYISQRFGVVKYNLNTSELTLVAGSNASVHTDRPKGYETRDGPLFAARFGGMSHHIATKQSVFSGCFHFPTDRSKPLFKWYSRLSLAIHA